MATSFVAFWSRGFWLKNYVVLTVDSLGQEAHELVLYNQQPSLVGLLEQYFLDLHQVICQTLIETWGHLERLVLWNSNRITRLLYKNGLGKVHLKVTHAKRNPKPRV